MHAVAPAWARSGSLGSIGERFTSVAEAYAERPALRGPAGTMSYRTLLDSARRVAAGIASAPGRPGQPVALVFDHDTPSIVAILGSLLAGRPYVAFDPAVPASRHHHVLADLRPSVIVSERRHLDTAAEFDAGNVGVVEYEVLLESDPLVAPLDESSERVAGIFYTSGTTGRPKGVIRTHGTILHRTMLDSVPSGFGPDDTFSLLYSTSFGTSVNDIFSALLNGGTLAVHDVLALGVGATADWIADEPITVLHAPIALMRRLVDAMPPGRRLPHLRMMIPSGRLYGADLRRFFEHLPDDAVIISRYASTETSLVCRLTIDARTPMKEGVVPVGKPVGDKLVRIERPDGSPADVDEVGEIVVSSRFLTPGYWNDEERTESALEPDPDRPGSHLYRTGDHGRLLADGLLEFVGRKDDRVKIRGYRIELDDVVSAVHGIEGVREATVRVVTHAGSDHLVAYVVVAGESHSSPADVRRRLEAVLPGYMVPSFVVELPELPLTAAGKIDAAALPALSTRRPEQQVGYVAPRSTSERSICDIWSDVLGIAPIGVHDRFLDLGGDSLGAMQIIGRVLERFGVDLPVRSLLDAGTVEAMASAVGEPSGGGSSTQIPRRAADATVPATAGQMAIWLAEQIGSATNVYNMLKVVEFDGLLDPQLLSSAVDQVLDRQSALRTTFHLEGERVIQRILPPPRGVLEFVQAEPRDVDALVAELESRPFDLANDLPFRALLVSTSAERHVLAIVNHHIVGDRGSSRLLLAELSAAYRALASGRPPEGAELAIEYADYALWQQGTVDDEELERQVAFWVERLTRSETAPGLVEDGPSGSEAPVHLCFDGDRNSLTSLDRLAAAHGVSRFVALASVVAVAVRAVTRQTHVTIGTPVSGRIRPELRPLIGYFGNLVAIPLDVSARAMEDVVSAAGRAVAEALEHADAPFDRIVARLAPERHPGRLPFVEVMVSYDQVESDLFDFGEVRARRRRDRLHRTRAPISVNGRAHDDGLTIDVVFDPGLVPPGRGERLLAEVEAALGGSLVEGRSIENPTDAMRSGS